MMLRHAFHGNELIVRIARPKQRPLRSRNAAREASIWAGGR
jgi:hypothetical protein